MQQEQPFDYTRVPHDYAHCFNHDCPRAAECLRHLTGLHIPKDVPLVRCVSPSVWPTDADKCPHYRTTKKIRSVRRLWAHTSYQRMARYERPITPELQQKIVRILARKGITTPPRYDYITEEYDFR